MITMVSHRVFAALSLSRLGISHSTESRQEVRDGDRLSRISERHGMPTYWNDRDVGIK